MKEPTPSGWWGRLTALRANVSPFPSLMQGVSGFAACVVFLLFTRCWLFHSVCAGLGSPLLIEKKRKTTQAAKHSLHQLRKRRHIGPKCRESPPPTTRCWLFHSVCAGLGSPLLIEKKRKTTQAAKHSLHQLRKRRHMQVWIAPSSRWPPAMCLIPRVGQDSAYTPYIW